MLTICTWRWGTKYGPEYVEKLQASVARNLTIRHQFFCVGDDEPIQDQNLLSVRDGCYARLRMFDPDWLPWLKWGITRLVCLDLDLVITSSLDELLSRPEPFNILHGGHFNPCAFNGSVMMIDRGARPELWSRFSVKEAEAVATADGTWRGSDQTWIAHVAPDAPGWSHRDGIYGYQKPGWNTGNDLPDDARIVAFPGSKDPSRLMHLPWVRDNWRA